MPGTTVKNPLSPRPTGEVSILEAQRIKKIRVNRVSLIQELRVEFVLRPLVERGVLSVAEHDFIQQGVSAQDRTRRLVDLIPTKGKAIDWFNIFREVLLEPEGDETAKLCCRRIISYLDNTIISKPRDVVQAVKAQRRVVSPVSETDKCVKMMSYPKYNPLPDIQTTESVSVAPDNDFTSRQSIVRFNLGSETKQEVFEMDTRLEETEPETEYEDMYSEVEEIDIGEDQILQPLRLWQNISVDPFFRKPTDLFEVLQKGESEGDLQQLSAEEMVWSNVQHLEVPLDLFHKKKLGGPFNFLLCKELLNILMDKNNHHLYLKYMNQLKYEKYFDLLKELETLYIDLFEHVKPVEHTETRNHLVDLGFGLASLLEQYSYYTHAEKTLSALVTYLCSSESQDCWVQQFNAYIKLYSTRIACLEFSLADHAYYAAQKIAEKIESMPESAEGFSYAEMYWLTSMLTRQRGSIAPALTWSQKALQDVHPFDSALKINIMCEAVKTYCSKWCIKEAELISVEAVKQAKKYFGTNHPLFLKSLLTYCHFSCLFRKDTLGVNVAMYALEIAQKIFGIASKDQDIDLINSNLLLAHAHRELAKAIGLCKTGIMNRAMGYEHANQAYRMALDILPGLHPQLSKFRYSLACCALSKENSEATPTEMTEDLEWAKSKVKEALADARLHFGEISLKVAKLHSLLAQIYIRMERFEDAEENLKTSVHLLKYCMPKNSNHIYVVEGGLATLYKGTGRPSEAINIYKDVVDNADTDGVYVEWIDTSYISLVELLRATNDMDKADQYQAKHTDWLNACEKLPASDLWSKLEMPPLDYEEFLGLLHLWSTRQSSRFSGAEFTDGEN